MILAKVFLIWTDFKKTSFRIIAADQKAYEQSEYLKLTKNSCIIGVLNYIDQ